MVDDDLQDRLRELASEVEGEKGVTRHLLTKLQKIDTEITGVSRDIHLLDLKLNQTGDMVVLVQAALNLHGARLETLTRDVTLLRGELTALRREMAGELVELRRETAGEFVELRREMAGEFVELRREMTGNLLELRREMAGNLAAGFDAQRVELRREMTAGFDAVMAAIARITPPA